ncbi:MAG: proton-conducting transporter membrane subunit [candidate division WOR-3 bacterium]|nr:proton-conducting transporter membrane subunit [candidate division WOR-3 bacterium]
MERILLYPIVMPFLAGLFTLIVPGLKRFKQLITVGVTGYLLYYGFRLFLLPTLAGYFFTVNIFTFQADFILKANHISSFMILFTYLFGFLISIYLIRSRDWVNSGDNQFLTYYLWTLAGVSGVFLSANLFFLLVFWEMVTAVFFLFINLGRGKLTAESARKTYIILGLADAAFLFGVGYIWTHAGTLNMDLISIDTTLGVIPKIVFFTFIAASIAKAGAIPLHTWIPAISENAPITVMAFIPASLDKLMGIYLLALTMLKLFKVQFILSFVVMLIGALTIIIAVLMALIQHNLRKLLAYHAISQVGYMVLGIGTGNPVGVIGGLFHMLNNAIYKGGLFLCAGAIEKETGTTELEELGGLYNKMPLVMIANVILALAISGVPPLNGFTSKWMVYQGTLLAHQPVFLILAIFGSALTLASFLKVIYSVYFGGKSPVCEHSRKPSYLMSIPITILALLCLYFGIFATFPVSKFFQPMEFSILQNLRPLSLLGDLSFIRALWNPSLATTAIIMGLILGVIIYLVSKGFRYREQPIYTGGERFELEERRFPGTGLYLTILELPIIGQYLKDKESGAYDGYNIVKFIGWEMIIKKLKNLHDGILSTYLSWCIVGFMIIMFILMGR